MAETTTLTVLRGCTLTLSDGTSPAAKSYTVILTEGAVTFTNGAHDIVRARDTDGDFLGVARQGAQSGPSTITFTAMMFGTGDDATDIALTDIVNNAGLFADGTWVSTSTDSEFVTVDATFSIPALDVKDGATYAWNDCVVQPGSSVEATRDGFRLSLTLESPDAYPTITTVAPTP